MRWIVLLAVLGGIAWTANWSYHHVDNAILITDIWEAKNTTSEWGLVNFKDKNPIVYDYVGTRGLWNIFNSLWPVWMLFILSFFILIPLTVYIFNGLQNHQIIAAKEAQRHAEERAKKAESNAKDDKERTEMWAEAKVKAAYQEQLTKVKKELETEWENYHTLKNHVLERESTIQTREKTAQQQEESAKEQIESMIEQYNQERARFDAEIQQISKARNNAQSGHQRLKNEKERITHFLSKIQWRIGNETLTYDKLRSLTKESQRLAGRTDP